MMDAWWPFGFVWLKHCFHSDVHWLQRLNSWWKRGSNKSRRKRKRIEFNWNELWSNDDASNTQYMPIQCRCVIRFCACCCCCWCIRKFNDQTNRIIRFTNTSKRWCCRLHTRCAPTLLPRCQMAKECVHRHTRQNIDLPMDASFLASFSNGERCIVDGGGQLVLRNFRKWIACKSLSLRLRTLSLVYSTNISLTKEKRNEKHVSWVLCRM